MCQTVAIGQRCVRLLELVRQPGSSGDSQRRVRLLGLVRQPASSGDSQRGVRLFGLIREVCQTVGTGQTAWVTWEDSGAFQSVGIGEAVQVICGQSERRIRLLGLVRQSRSYGVSQRGVSDCWDDEAA